MKRSFTKRDTYIRQMTPPVKLLFFTFVTVIFYQLLLQAPPATAGTKTCGSFYLRNSEGKIINPLTGENSDQPFSTKKTCGACHNYEKITQGYHFQQGWEKVSDTFSESEPWVLSDGMMGKH